MEYVNLANLEWFTAWHCICIAIVCVFQFGDGTGESRQSDGDKREKLAQSLSGVALEGGGSALQVRGLLLLWFLALH